ncbi:MAG: alpha/beta hydrolase family protein [Planctomycetota bacterium]
MVKSFLAAALFLAALDAVAAGEADLLDVLPEKIDGIAPQEMMHHYLLGRALEALDRRDAEYEKIKTAEDIAAYQERMRRFFVDRLGGFPKRTPLGARVVGSEDRDGYRVEKVIFESQPRHYVTALLYLPDTEPPYPGVLVPCGHSSTGKARDLYQRAPILVAKSGMAALCYDPLDQGERHQLVGDDGKPIIASSTMGHCLAGVGAILVGRNTATYRTWDGMRAIDYLQSRPEVDPERIGCTGISGGGTMTSYLMALDDRITAAAPGCYLCGFRKLLETIGPQDAEQDICGQIAFGMDHGDYVMMRAPKPTLIMTATGDYFDIDGAWSLFRQSKRLYTRLGYAERVDLFETDTRHGWPPPMREAAARWMRRWLLGIDDAIVEADFPIATEEEAQCTPRGEVMLLPGARSVYDLNVEREAELAKARKDLWSRVDTDEALDEVRRITGIRRLADLAEPEWEKTGTIRREGYRIDKLILRPEPGIWLPALACVPDEPSGKAVLYVDGSGKQEAASLSDPVEDLIRKRRLVLAVDLRGVGETANSQKHRFAEHVGPEWREIFAAYLLDTSYLTMRAEDVLVCARFLAGYEAGEKPNEVSLISIGLTGPPALHAAALEPQLFARVTLKNSLISWSDVVRTPLARNQLVNVVHGALAHYDLPDLLGATPDVAVIDAVDAAGEPIQRAKSSRR